MFLYNFYRNFTPEIPPYKTWYFRNFNVNYMLKDKNKICLFINDVSRCNRRNVFAEVLSLEQPLSESLGRFNSTKT